jgi:hypothetical protein
MCPTPLLRSADITGLYAAKFGAPPVGSKVFVTVAQFMDGWEDMPSEFSAIVPTAA